MLYCTSCLEQKGGGGEERRKMYQQKKTLDQIRSRYLATELSVRPKLLFALVLLLCRPQQLAN